MGLYGTGVDMGKVSPPIPTGGGSSDPEKFWPWECPESKSQAIWILCLKEAEMTSELKL